MQQLLDVTLSNVAHGGHCVARHEGRVIFVRHGLPGERVRVRFTENDDDARFWRADVVEVVDPAPGRVPHFWREADALLAFRQGVQPVGGAEFGHISLGVQRELKGHVFAEQLNRLAGLEREIRVEAPVGEDPAGLGWRSRLAFAVTPGGRLAMHAHRSADLIPVQQMPLGLPVLNGLGLWNIDFSGIARIEVAAPSSGDMPLLLLYPKAGTTPARLQRIARSLPHLPAALVEGDTSVAESTPTGSGSSAAAGSIGMSVIAIDENGVIERLRGRTWARETTNGHDFRVTGPGFWQIHRLAPATLSRAVMAGLDPATGEHVADLYAGAGLFSAALADAVGPQGSVLSVEGSAAASRDARKNLHGLDQVRVQPGRVEKVLHNHQGKLDVVLLDPPRAGAGRRVVDQLSHAAPRAIGYVSCDPASFARDLAYFGQRGWTLQSLQVFDLYPHTHHMESFAVLVQGS